MGVCSSKQNKNETDREGYPTTRSDRYSKDNTEMTNVRTQKKYLTIENDRDFDTQAVYGQASQIELYKEVDFQTAHTQRDKFKVGAHVEVFHHWFPLGWRRGVVKANYPDILIVADGQSQELDWTNIRRVPPPEKLDITKTRCEQIFNRYKTVEKTKRGGKNVLKEYLTMRDFERAVCDIGIQNKIDNMRKAFKILNKKRDGRMLLTEFQKLTVVNKKSKSTAKASRRN